MDFQRKLPIPQEVKREFPLTEKMEQVKKNRDEVIRSVFEGQSASYCARYGFDPCKWRGSFFDEQRLSYSHAQTGKPCV